MKHSVQLFLTTYLCIAATSSIAMEELFPLKEKKPKIITEITVIQKPQYAQYLSNGHIVVAGENGCSIIDPIANTEIKKINELENQKLAIHPNKKLFTLVHKNIINLYDATTHSLKWSKIVDDSFEKEMNPYDVIRSVTFAPHNTSIALITTHFRQYQSYTRPCAPESYHIQQYNYVTDKSSDYTCPFNDYPPLIAFNPMHNEICVTDSIGTCFHQPDNIVYSKDTKRHQNYDKYVKRLCQYNPDGSYIAQVDYQDEIFIINTQDLEQYESFKKNTQKWQQDQHDDIKDICFYSNSVLAILSGLYIYEQKKYCHSILSYFDIHTKECIHTNPLLDASPQHDFSFSPDTTKVIIALEDKCVILPVPFKVMYKDITKKQFFYLLFVLKNYTAIEIPHDVRLLIATTIHERYKRH
jgi:hypothetical protein